MPRVNEKNRSFVFLAVVLVVGLLLIGVVSLIDNGVESRDEHIENPPKTNSLNLENKIANLRNQNFSPSAYSTLSTEIEASHSEKLITSQVKENLLASLSQKYSELVYERCESFLNGSNAYNSRELMGLLNQLEGITSGRPKISRYKEQISLYEYYSKTFPATVERFIEGGVGNFTDNTYINYKDSLQQMPGLDAKYRNTPKLNQIRSRLIAGLEDLYGRFTELDLEILNE